MDTSFSNGELNFNRFSVMDSMLSSLSDVHNHSSSFDDPHYSSAPIQQHKPQPTLSNTGRRRGHTQSSSMSDYDGGVHVDEIASRYAEYHANGRRVSKQSARPLTGIKTSTYGNSAAESSRHTRGSVTKGSKSSGSSSVDLGYRSSVMNTKSIPHRAASFDHGYSPIKTFSNVQGKESPVPIDYTAYDAAPTPTIPAGPRRPSEPVSPLVTPLSPNPSKQKPAPSRRNSVKSTAGKSLKKSKSTVPMSNNDIREQAKQFVQYNSVPPSRPAPAPTASAPSPTVATIRKAHPSSAPTAAKEPRPGFFRRVFGSSKHDRSTQEEAHRPPSPAAIRQMSFDTSGNRPRTQPNQQHQHLPVKSASRPPTQDPSMSASFSRELQPPLPLRKAHSSFFRRRKKSMSENAPPPVPPLDLQSQQPSAPFNIAAPLKSPGATSLRAAMTPYLDQATSPQDMFFDSHEQPASGSPVNYGFSSTIPNALGIARSSSRAGPREIESQHALRHTNPILMKTMTADSSKPRANQPTVAGNIEDGSFLADSSSSEAMGNSSPTDVEDPRAARQMIGQATSDPHWNSSVSGVHDKLTTQRANVGEKRSDGPMLSPISDRSLRHPEGDDSTRFLDDDNDDGVVISVNRRQGSKAEGNTRVWLDPSSSDEKLSDALRLKLPLEGPRIGDRPSQSVDQVSPSSENDLYASASSLPTLQVDSRTMRMSKEWQDAEAAKVVMDDELDITESDRERAQMIFDGDEELVSKAGAAAWLGQTTPRSTRTRKAYMELFDWAGVNILAAFRELCGKLVVKAESQQLDRVIEAFSGRWCVCNPANGFKDSDVVHTITFSILMLNTDLHIADIDQRMTRSQFVKNTLPTIRSIADAAEPDAPETVRAKVRQARDQIPWDSAGSNEPEELPKRRPSIEVKRNRLSMRPPMRGDSYDDSGSSDGCNILVKAPCAGSMKDWETQIEIVLREFYNSIRQQRLPLHGHNMTADLGASQNSQPGLSVLGSNGLRRTPSVLSKAPSENASYRGRSGEHARYNTGRFGSKNRSRPRVYPSSTIGSSRTSLDDNSVWSPAASTWSKYSLSKTQASMMSVESFGSDFAPQDFQKAIGFANALSQAIIREEGMAAVGSMEDANGRVVPLLEDETLGLAGPPWAKEGIVKHKHHLESLEKKAKDRNWAECFAVIEKGWIKLFSFGGKSKTVRQRAKSRGAAGPGAAPVGGGNWLENADLLNEFLLRQTIASALPSPGYSKSRPHVFALSLPTGAVHLFQVGTADIVKEFVTSANYWSARLSKPPLIGGVSNIEYGWGDNILNPAVLLQRPESATPGQTPGTSSSNQSVSMGRSSVSSPTSPGHGRHSSIGGRKSEDQASIGYRIRLPGDKVVISEWSPPTQSMMASQLLEVDQHKDLSTYVGNVEEELKKHNELRSLMGMAFSPRHPNAGKAMANWEKKSAYLLREIVKFKTYVDSLKAAQQAKEVIYQERDARIAEKAALGTSHTQEASNPVKADADAPSVPPVPPQTAQSV